MAFEQKPESGSLFHNDRRDNENSPHHKGSALIGGAEYWVSGWNRTKKDGETWVSLSFKLKEQREMPVYKPKPMPPPDEGFDDYIPF